MSNATHNYNRGWDTNKKKGMYIVPKLKSEKRKNVDKIYIGGHLINNYYETHRKSANVAFSFFFNFIALSKLK